MDELSTIITEIGAKSDEALDMYVGLQARFPLNFKDLTEVMLEGSGHSTPEFFLASMVATAVIRLAVTQTAGAEL